jgi:uncharacterized membrane protein
MEAFSDGVLAIIITIMVLEIKVPHGTEWKNLIELLPVFISYTISFLMIGIYWGNHHHLLHTVKNINSNILLANLHLLFWLSLVPFATGWMGENHFEPNSIILYASILVFCGIAYGILQNNIIRTLDEQSKVIVVLKKQNKKVAISVLLVLLAIPFSFVHPAIPGALFFMQSAIWLIPDKNIEKALKN